jgi:excisionase family DNA binding protein
VDTIKPLSEQRLLLLDEIVERTSLSSRTWRRIIARGDVGVVRIQGSVRIPEAELDAYLQRNFTPPIGRRHLAPAAIEEIIDKAVPRRRAGGTR